MPAGGASSLHPTLARAGAERSTTNGDNDMNIRNLSFLLLPLALVAAQATAACTATAITPYIRNGGTWSQTASATVAATTSLVFGPHPTTGGSWAWSGCGTGGSAREQTITAKSSCTATATYTNSCGAKSTQAFAITVPGMRDLTSLQLSQQMGAGWNLGNSLEAIGGETAWGNPAVNHGDVQRGEGRRLQERAHPGVVEAVRRRQRRHQRDLDGAREAGG
jgi:hypothetical protein